MYKIRQGQFLGVWGIYKESCKIILFSGKKLLFTQINLALLLPLSLVLSTNALAYSLLPDFLKHQLLLPYPHAQVLEWTQYCLFKTAALISPFLVLSLLSSAAVTYTVASIYTTPSSGSPVRNLKEMITKRLVLTFACNFVVGLAYILAAFFSLFLVFDTWMVYIPKTWMVYTIWVALLALFSGGFAYLQLVWHLATVVSVVEERSGLEAMVRSGVLMEGKTPAGAIIILHFHSCYMAILAVQEYLRTSPMMMDGVWFIFIACSLLITVLFLFGLVVQTVFYYVCKSYHRESIHKSVLFDHATAEEVAN